MSYSYGTNFTRKGYGRIYVLTEEAIERVHAIIKEMDEYEYGYMPKGLVTTFDQYPRVVYLHKFCDLDLDRLTAICWHRGVMLWCFDNGSQEYADDKLRYDSAGNMLAEFAPHSTE